MDLNRIKIKFFIEKNNIEEWKVMTKKVVARKLVKKLFLF